MRTLFQGTGDLYYKCEPTRATHSALKPQSKPRAPPGWEIWISSPAGFFITSSSTIWLESEKVVAFTFANPWNVRRQVG